MKRTKISLLTLITLFFTGSLLAQARTVSTRIENEDRNAVVVEIYHPLNYTEHALQARLQQEGLTGILVNGSIIYKGVTLSEISRDKMDLYTRVEHGDNNSSLVYLSVSRNYNGDSNLDAEGTVTRNTEAFLDAFVKDLSNRISDVAITGDLKAAGKSEKQYQKLLDEQRDLEQKRSKIDSRLADIQHQLTISKVDRDRTRSAVDNAQATKANNNN
jgi:hypothetical protein